MPQCVEKKWEKEMSERFPLIDEHLSSIRTKVSSLEEKLSSLPYTPKEDFDKLRKEYETFQKSISDSKLRSSNAYNGSSSSSHSVNSSLLTEVQSRLDINDELLSEHQKILSRYNTKFLEKKDIKQYITDNILTSNLFEQILSKNQNNIDIRISQVETKVNDILTNKIPNLTNAIYLRQNK